MKKDLPIFTKIAAWWTIAIGAYIFILGRGFMPNGQSDPEGLGSFLSFIFFVIAAAFALPPILVIVKRRAVFVLFNIIFLSASIFFSLLSNTFDMWRAVVLTIPLALLILDVKNWKNLLN